MYIASYMNQPQIRSRHPDAVISISYYVSYIHLVN